MAVDKIIETDVLVIGGGIAGACAAIEARKKGLDVTIVDKNHVGTTGCTYFSGMNFTLYNEEMGSDFNLVMKAITEGSEYTNDRDWTEIVMRESWAAYEKLAAWGVEFPVEEKEGRVYTLYPPFLQARTNDMQVSRPLRPAALKAGVRIIDRVFIQDLLVENGRVAGAVGFPLSCLNTYIFKAKTVVLSTGLWAVRNSTGDNHEATGDGPVMAYRIGAELTGGTGGGSQAHGWQYHSWSAGRAARSVFRYYTDALGNRIAHGYESDATLEYVFHEGRGPIYHDLDPATPEDLERVWKRQQNSDARTSARIGYDPRDRGKYRLAGGGGGGIGAEIWPVDKYCASTIPGLYSAGTACGTRSNWWGGLSHGAVTGARAGMGAAEYALKSKRPTIDSEQIARLRSKMFAPLERKSGFDPRWVTQLLINTMTPYYVLSVMRADRLQAALTMVEFFRDQYVPKLLAADSHELRLAHEVEHMALGSEISLKASLMRRESRGLFYREDYPRRDDPAWLAWIKLKQVDGQIQFWKEPIPDKWRPDLSIPYVQRYPKRFPGEEVLS